MKYKVGDGGFILPESPADIVSDYKLRKHEEIKRQNALNKARSKAMENRIAKRLNGHRVPMSGAGGMKGDALVYSPLGLYIVECKYTARVTSKGVPCFTFPWAFLPKLEKDVQAMRAAFGILIFHYHNIREDFVIVRESDWQRIKPDYVRTQEILKVNNASIALPLDIARNGGIISKPIGDYIVMNLDEFIYAMDDWMKEV